MQLGGGGGPAVARVTGDAVARNRHDRARGARGEARNAAVGGRDGDRARRQARGRERRHAVDQRLAVEHSVLVAEGDRPAVRGRPARRQVADRRGERDRLPGTADAVEALSAVMVGRPLGAIRSTPMLAVHGSVNQMLPSGPLVIASGWGPLAPGTVVTVVETGVVRDGAARPSSRRYSRSAR